jgi:hypothetical protein
MKLFKFGQPRTPAATHTSGFADAADSGAPSFGAVSPESFEQRKHIDSHRQHIAKFREAEIHRDYRKHHLQNRAISPEREHIAKPQTPAAKPAQAAQPIVRPATGYREPQSRGFNPFR